MNKERLLDYDAKETEHLSNYFEKIKNRGLEASDRFPQVTRFSTTLNEPIVVVDRQTFYFDNQKIWSQVRFAGTLIIPLPNLPQNDILNANGFEIDDIPKLIDIAKQTGRVQFGLTTYPRYYEGLDHLDPILEELKPPLLSTIPYSALIDEETASHWQAEFHTLSKIRFQQYMMNSIRSHLGADNRPLFEATMLNREGSFLRLKILGMDSLIQEITDAMVDDPKLADVCMVAVTQATDAIFGGLRASNNLSLSKIRHFGLDAFQLPSSENQIRYPVEIGRFLMEKITLNPANYYGCIDVIQHYEQNELYKILQSLNAGIKEQSMNTVVENVTQLNSIMDNIWDTSHRIKKAGQVIQGGFRIALGLAGLGIASTILPTAAATGVGLLAQLGVNVADQYVEGKGLGERVARLLNKRFVTTIYDFNQKHSLPKSKSK